MFCEWIQAHLYSVPAVDFVQHDKKNCVYFNWLHTTTTTTSFVRKVFQLFCYNNDEKGDENEVKKGVTMFSTTVYAYK